MALWLNRAGAHGEYEKIFIDDNRIYLTWEGLREDLSQLRTRKEFNSLLYKTYPNVKPKTIVNWLGQVWPFIKDMKEGDWVVLPSKLKSAAIHIAEITGPYVYDGKADDPYYHYRKVKWIEMDIPRSNFDQDILYSFGSLRTVCQIRRNNAEKRIREMAKNGWKPQSTIPPIPPQDDDIEDNIELEQLARDQIAKMIIRKYKGHGLARLVEALLNTQGYTTYLSPQGPDKGVDILAAPGPLGFGNPRICVQVKSGDTPVDLPTLNQLIGTMQNVQAQQGLFVSWAGFKSSIDKEIPSQFFRVRLWDQDNLIDVLLANYDKLSEDMRAELPLKRIWTIAETDEESSPS